MLGMYTFSVSYEPMTFNNLVIFTFYTITPFKNGKMSMPVLIATG
jgi:hypothetical protein